MRKDNLNTKQGTAVLDRDDTAGTLKDFYRPTAPDSRRVLAGVGRPTPIEFPDDLDAEEGGREAPSGGSFMRNSRRAHVRKGWIPASKVSRILLGCGMLAAIAGLVAAVIAVRGFLLHDSRFRIEASSSIRILGNSHVTRPQLLSTFGEDIGRNIFYVPLEQRRVELEELPWVERATVMRLLPDRLRVSVVERTPVAFVRQGNHIGLVDAHGVLLGMPSGATASSATGEHYSFPVLVGISANEPLSTREARMKIYERFVAGLDSTGERISQQLSEVDLSEPEDVRALIFDKDSDIMVHFGDSDFIDRFHSFQSHLADWRRQYPRLASVDMRYPRQVVLEMQAGSGIPAADSSAAESGKAADERDNPDAKTVKAVAKPDKAEARLREADPKPANKVLASVSNGPAQAAMAKPQIPKTQGKSATAARPVLPVDSASPLTAVVSTRSAAPGAAAQAHVPAHASNANDPLEAADATLASRSARTAAKIATPSRTASASEAAPGPRAAGHASDTQPAVAHAAADRPANSQAFHWTPKAAGKHSAAHPVTSAAQPLASAPSTGKTSSIPAAQRGQTQ